MMLLSSATLPQCRIAKVKACEGDEDAANSNDIQAVGLFQMRVRDELDFRVDFTEWVAANGNPPMSGAVFTVASGSPQSPTISGQAFSPDGMSVVVLKAAVGAEPGHAYYLDVTANFGPTVPIAPGALVIPARKMVRRIHVVVIAG